MKWNNIKTTIFKELRGVIRDKKSLHKLIVYPLIIPIIILLFGFLFDSMNESDYLIGTNYEPTKEEKLIIKEIDSIKTKKYDDKKSLEKAFKNNEIDGYITKNNNTYKIYADDSQNSGAFVLSYATTYLESYNKLLGSKELLVKNIDPNTVFNKLNIEIKSLKSENENLMTTVIFSLVITYLIMIVVMVCVVAVTDATSGEKERGTLETILTFPVRSSELVLGKYLATSILGFIVGLASYILSIPTVIIGSKLFVSYKDMIISTKLESILLVVLVIFLTSLLASGICMALAGNAKTYKEAQSSLQFISLLPMIPYILQMLEIDNEIFNLIPIANCGSLLNEIIVNNINYNTIFTVIATTILYTVVIIFYISKQYKKEETLFS